MPARDTGDAEELQTCPTSSKFIVKRGDKTCLCTDTKALRHRPTPRVEVSTQSYRCEGRQREHRVCVSPSWGEGQSAAHFAVVTGAANRDVEDDVLL